MKTFNHNTHKMKYIEKLFLTEHYTSQNDKKFFVILSPWGYITYNKSLTLKKNEKWKNENEFDRKLREIFKDKW